jgi:predicted nucleic acid-binding Zn ribbon protein
VTRADGPSRLAVELQKYLRATGLDERVEEAAVLPEWSERVGAAIALVTMPLRVSRGTLVVAVRTSAWLMELRMMERDIVRALNHGRARGHIERVRFVMADELPPGVGF